MIQLLPNVAEKVGLPIKVDETGQPNKIQENDIQSPIKEEGTGQLEYELILPDKLIPQSLEFYIEA